MNEAQATMARVIVTRPLMGICHMQVCAVHDATDEEIFSVCNADNESGTTRGWGKVIREDDRDSFWNEKGQKCPVVCQDNPDRKHFMVMC